MNEDKELLRDMKRSSPRGLLAFAGVIAVVPFALSFALNGNDFVKLVGGGLACLLAVVGGIRALKGDRRAVNVGLSLSVLVVGAFHVATSGVLGALNIDPFGMSEADAREWLEERGDEILVLERGEEGFSYTVVHEEQRCTGSLVINSSFSGTSSRNFETCGVSATDDEYRRECAAGRATSCQNLGIRLAETNPGDALVYFRQSCEGGVGGGCTNAGLELRRTGNTEEAIIMSERGCTMGDAAGCGNLGVFLLPREGDLSEEVVTRAKGYLEQACAAAVYPSCGRLAWEISFGRRFPQNPVRGRELFAAACEADVFASCADLAVLYRDGEGGPADVTQGLRYATRACEGGHFPLSCRMQGEFLIDQSEGFNAAALAAFRAACQSDERTIHVGGACVQAGLHLYNHVEPKPEEEIVALWTRACDLDDRDGCRDLGVMHRNGDFGPPNPAAALPFFQKSCRLGFEPACREPGVQTP